jgi:hypothetical protein
MLHFQNQISAAGRPPTTKNMFFYFFWHRMQPSRTCLALAKKDSSVILCRTCEKNGKTVCEKCHRKHQQASCDCNICTQHEHANLDGTTKHDQEAPKRKRHRSKLDYSQKAQKDNIDSFFVDKGKLHADVCADGRKAKSQHSPNTNTTTANAKKRSATGCHPGKICQQGNVHSKQCQDCKLRLCSLCRYALRLCIGS